MSCICTKIKCIPSYVVQRSGPSSLERFWKCICLPHVPRHWFTELCYNFWRVPGYPRVIYDWGFLLWKHRASTSMFVDEGGQKLSAQSSDRCHPQNGGQKLSPSEVLCYWPDILCLSRWHIDPKSQSKGYRKRIALLWFLLILGVLSWTTNFQSNPQFCWNHTVYGFFIWLLRTFPS